VQAKRSYIGTIIKLFFGVIENSNQLEGNLLVIMICQCIQTPRRKEQTKREELSRIRTNLHYT